MDDDVTSGVGIHEVHWDNKWMGSPNSDDWTSNESNSWPVPQRNKTKRTTKQDKRRSETNEARRARLL